MRATVPTVFSCVASRNKRAHRAFYWQPLPCIAFTAVRRTARAGRLPLGRPANSRCSLRSARASNPNQFQPNAPLQFCRVRPRRALLMQPAAGGGGELRGSKSRRSSTHSPPQFCRIRAARYHLSQPKSVGFVLGAPPRAAKASPLPRTAIPEESRYSLSD